MTEIKRVVLMLNNPDAVGGVTTFVNTIAPGFRDAGYEVELLTVEQMHSDEEYLLDPTFKHCIGVASAMPTKRNFVRVRDYLDLRIYRNRRIYKKLKDKACKNLTRVYKEWGRDTVLIITQVYGAEHLIRGGVDISTNNGPYVVGMYHDSFEQATKGRDMERLVKNFKQVDRLLCLTGYDAEQFRKRGFTNIGYMHNPVSIEAPKAAIDKENIVVSLGRYHPQKSLDYLINAWGEIAKDYPDWRLEMYGDGNERAKLQKLIDKLDINDNTKLMGKTNKVKEVLSRSSINTLSSQHEGLPLAIVEAARFGVPTVAFDCAPGISELIDNGKTGIVTPRNNAHLLAEGIKSLISDDQRRNAMGAAAHKRSLQYETDKIIKQWEHLFDDLTF
jgi:glycosyltransferase involved in cell wall biosynthesis